MSNGDRVTQAITARDVQDLKILPNNVSKTLFDTRTTAQTVGASIFIAGELIL